MDIRNEILFWLKIMEEHALFQAASLSCKEQEFVAMAEHFKKFFAGARQQIEAGTPIEAIKHVIMKELQEFILFKKQIVRRLLICQIEISMAPTFVNHMINEAIEFEKLLIMPPPSQEPLCIALALVELHKIWLADASGHAGAIASNLDGTEHILAKQARKFKENFSHLFIKSCELYEMLIRTHLVDGALKLLTLQADKEINAFIEYLRKVEEYREDCMAMATGTTSPLLPDHMIREEQYYLSKAKHLLMEINR